ncbi:hypothetical protein DICVIV_13063 [Dictyocaulus viviparus]|uniref:Uncharacterized protein n=1 Tax=Dictyocaulus viviparus TaxID=29172 RepID=A0A0D8XB16_DICVI|nr:hypothetical protein DICVIV_13063 [Dictyocaulus viviparus]
MLRNRIENMEREKERLAAATRDQIISKEKQHAAELLKKDERISQLETQIQCLVSVIKLTMYVILNVFCCMLVFYYC